MKVATILAVLVSAFVAVDAQCQNPTYCGGLASRCRAGPGRATCIANCAAATYTCYGATLKCGSQCR
ncbi:hypothetical protein HK097_007080 [Rhizophlyctis rosea]|uniref:Uncharacterized protein n=1 Tax=Rhizophlyctis rosea TaxID=64517 RepID=A0AAD5SK08_9FUNG|nr:hypothetical protein HK097_007080 [Rhizophlyctis rosea]